MDQRLSLITLGVADVSRAQAFYEALGWHLDDGVNDENDHIAFFQAGGFIFSLWGREKLAEDSGVEDRGSWAGITLGYYVGSPDEVDSVLSAARSAGARITRPGGTTFWGGYSGVFVDLDGHPWEVGHNPAWTVHDDGSVTLGGGRS
jgi:catechol 2,3-dioxygenase-like lactoylglutathione lyase family enzyme